MKQAVGVLLLASTLGLAVAATSSASTDTTAASCPAVQAEVTADVAAAQKAAATGDYAAEISIANEIKKLAKTGCTASSAPAGFSGTLPAAIPGTPYPPTTFCRGADHIVSGGTQCDNADGRPITFKNEGDLLPLGMSFDSFTGTVSGTPRIGQGTQNIRLVVCSRALAEDDYTNCTEATLKLT